MKKISILALHLGYGGIENCICSLANLLCNDYKVEIISIYKLYDKPVYQLNSKIKIKYLTTNLKPNRDEFKNALKHFNLLKSLALGLQAIKILYLKRQTMIKALKNDDSDITISTRIYLNKLLGKYGHGIKIGWEHNHHHGDSKYIKDFYQSCKHLDKVVLVSETLKNDYQKIFTQQHIQCECLYIPNFIVNWPKKANKLDNNNLISVGRLSKEKGFIDLICVYKLINLNYNDTFLNIVGDGSQKEQIEKNIIKDNM